jgi:hypothetical protein
MPSAFIKDSSGTWKHVKQQFVKVNDRWEPVKNVWIKENNVWHLGYSQSTGSVVYNTPTLGGIFKVPDDIYELKITYPDFVNTANNYVSTKLMTVTPGQSVNYSIGDYGQMSSFGDVAVAMFDKVVTKWSGDLDTWVYQLIGMVTGTNVISTSSLGDTAQLISDVNAAGIYFYQDNIDFHGSVNPFPDPGGPHGSWNYLTGTIAISTVPTQFIQGPVQAYLSEAPVIAGGTTVIETQPTKENNYTVRLQTVDPSANPRISTHYYALNLRQVMPITVSWGDWPPEDLYPITATIALTSISMSTGAGFNPPSGSQPYSVYAGGAVKYNIDTTNLTTGTLYYSVKTTKGRIPAKDDVFSVSGNFTATTTLSDGAIHNSYGTVNVVNSSSTATFTIAVSTSSFLNVGATSLISHVEIYKSQERNASSLLCTGPYVNIIPPVDSILDNSYCGSPTGTYGGTQFSRYNVVADGSGGYKTLILLEENSSLCGYNPPPSNLNQEAFTGGY